MVWYAGNALIHNTECIIALRNFSNIYKNFFHCHKSSKHNTTFWKQPASFFRWKVVFWFGELWQWEKVLVNVVYIFHVQPLSKITMLQFLLQFDAQWICQICGTESNMLCFMCSMTLFKEAVSIIAPVRYSWNSSVRSNSLMYHFLETCRKW